METQDSETAASPQTGKSALILVGIILVVVIGIGIWYAQKQFSGAAQSSAVAELKDLGAMIIASSEGKPNSLILSAPGKPPIDLDQALPLAVKLVSLDSLQLSGTAVSDEQLKIVGKMTGLGDLQLSDTPITDAGIKHLTGLSKLTSLYVNNTQLTSNALVEIAKLRKLKVLGIYKTAISGGFAPLESLEDLTLLVAGGLTVSEQDAEEIVRIPNLRRIDLTDGEVSPEAVTKLRTKIKDVAGVE